MKEKEKNMKEKKKSVKKETLETNSWKGKIKKVRNFIDQNFRTLVIGFFIVTFIFNVFVLSQTRKIHLSDGKQVIASIDDYDVTAEEVFEAMKEYYGTTTLTNIIDELIADREIEETEELIEETQEEVDSLRSQYETYGYDFAEVLTSYGYANEAALRNEILIDLKKEEVVKNYLKAELTEEEIEDYYDNEITDQYTVKHILISADSTDADAMAEAKSTAEEVIQQLQNGEEWATLVEEYSDDTSTVSTEGLIENFMKGDVVDSFYEASSNLEDGTYTMEPVESEYGYHIIYRISKQEKEALELIKEEVMDAIVTERLELDTGLVNTTWLTIRSNYHFTIYDDILKSLYDQTISE